MIYKKIEIKSEADLPKEDELKEYIVHLRHRDMLDKCIHNNRGIPHGYHSIVWVEYYDWYLLPISEEDYLREELIKYESLGFLLLSDIKCLTDYLKTRKDEKL